MKIQKIAISGFKSLERIEINDLCDFSIFAGANGSGKSNFFDALQFVSRVVSDGAESAIRAMGGYENIHCVKKRGSGARLFQFEIELNLGTVCWKYFLKVYDMDSEPKLSEELWANEQSIVSKKKSGDVLVFLKQGKEDEKVKIPSYPTEQSALRFASDHPFVRWISNIQVYRFDPLGAKSPDPSTTDATELQMHGHNLATMLGTLEKDVELRESIVEWMELTVPGLSRVKTARQRLDNTTVLQFEEEGTKKHFPANLISDGTIYILCILTALLSRKNEYGLTLIEEPERGIHPTAIQELMKLMRSESSVENSLLITTHNETIVRSSKIEELILVSKEDGKTQFLPASNSKDVLGKMPLDKAWLTNMFGKGLPW